MVLLGLIKKVDERERRNIKTGRDVGDGEIPFRLKHAVGMLVDWYDIPRVNLFTQNLASIVISVGK